METEDKFKIALTLACFAAAISIFLTSQYRKHRKHQKQCENPCYLKTETKPQYTFKRVLADNSYSPFKHLELKNDSSNDNFSNLHPYREEIASLLQNSSIEFEFFDGEFDSEMSDSYVWVETESQLEELVDILSEERVFAVDTEQHSLRSFLGFTALIQISTKSEDYLVDTIALHDVMGIIRPVFANPNICKVFHGADNDVLWLQRDFHIYVVNLFDTAKACDMLSKPQKSLAYLLETYCGVATNKKLQREDWRQRPLPKEMVQYARIDAHYLLYIAHCLVSELKQQDNDKATCPNDKFPCVLEASRRSNATSLQLFSKEIEVFPGESIASSMISRHLNEQGSSSIFHNTKFQELVRRLCAWRDLVARIHDESLRFVLSDHAIMGLVDKMPTSETDIYDSISQVDLNVDFLNCISSLQSPSPVVCSHWEDLSYLFQEEIGNPCDIFQLILQKHVGPNGSCPLSIYNYALLSKTNLKLKNGPASKQNGMKNARQVARKASRELFVQKFSCKAPVYHNCRIFANDGRLLCYCDRRKLEWYLRRDLAKLVDNNPPAIMLLFEPKGRPEDEGNDFYIQSKKNICVGCGEGNHYLRYRIIPSCYRMHFPEHLKSHRSHDIILLCVDCHEIAHAAAEKYKKQIAGEFEIPLYIHKVVDSSQSQDASGPSDAMNLGETDVSPLQLRTAAMALLRHGSRMPPERREELTKIVMKYYGGREISEEDLEKALLVGMSPHERRRLEKRKGLSFKHSMRNISPDKEPETSSGSGAKSVTDNTSHIDNVNNSHASNGEAGEEDHLLMVTDIDSSNSMQGSNCGVNREAYAADSKRTNSDASKFSEIKHGALFDDVNPTSSLNATVDPAYPRSDGTFLPSRHLKLSLLGHGPHGKQVVDCLLKEHGEDGIRQFCQRWRQVFVEAVHPRFLPAGWDVMHSGRREFGEYSVYNPAKNASAAS